MNKRRKLGGDCSDVIWCGSSFQVREKGGEAATGKVQTYDGRSTIYRCKILP